MEKKQFIKTRWMSPILWYVPIFFVQIISAQITRDNLDWLSSIQNPTFSPPRWLFGPVWTILYLLMAFSIWLIYLHKPRGKQALKIYSLFWLQLVLNLSWSVCFFYFHQIGWATIILALLIITIFLWITTCFRAFLASAVLLIPYLLWSSFALILNLTFWFLN